MKLGYSIVQLEYERIYNILKDTAFMDKGEYSVLVDENGTIICHTNNSGFIGSKIEYKIQRKLDEGNEGSFFDTVNGEDYLMLYVKDKDSEWSIVQVIPYRNILEKSREIRNFTIMVMLLFLTLALILAVIFSNNITYPIIKLKNVMDKFGAGDLMLRTSTDRNDEIGKLQQSFNLMADDIKNLLQKIENENKQRRILELNILEYQINPHFLYNTLDSINWMAQKSGQKDISEMVTALARFFRIGLSKGKEFIKIRDELEHANSYLIISKIRFKECFEFKFDVSEEILEYKTVKLILQPVIENAIKHGIDKDGKDGLIEIKGKLDEGTVILSVTDNGKGIDEEHLKVLRKLLINTSRMDDYGGGIGLINVNQRIKLNFGSEYGLGIESKLGYGTTVYIRIPPANNL
jgi:two-component system sensor histidine kinase YesM